jgi:hypothetical protein
VQEKKTKTAESIGDLKNQNNFSPDAMKFTLETNYFVNYPKSDKNL